MFMKPGLAGLFAVRRPYEKTQVLAVRSQAASAGPQKMGNPLPAVRVVCEAA